MTANTHSSALNGALVRLNRSLLQYAGESWPWADAEAAGERAVIDSLVERQRKHVGRLADLLLDRHWAPDFGVYPTEYTDLHYVALEYLLSLLVASEKDVLEELDRAQLLCIGDDQATQLLEQARADQRDIVEQLQNLADAHRAASGSPA